MKKTTIIDILSHIKGFSETKMEFFSEIVVLMKLYLVLPATNAVSERSASTMRRIKNWLRSTMKQERLNYCMLLSIHKEKTDAIDLVNIANEFSTRSESRLRTFGTFSNEDFFFH